MGDELPPDELKAIWQRQPTGTSTMTMRLIRSKARDLQAKTRRQLLGTVAAPLAAAFLYAFGIREFRTATRAAPAIRVHARMESCRAVLPEPWNVVHGNARRCGAQHWSGVLSRRDRAAALPPAPRSAVVVGAGAAGHRNIHPGVGDDWDQKQGTIPEWTSLPGSRRCVDTRVLRHESEGTARAQARAR